MPEIVALKRMLPHLADDMEFVTRFRREGNIAKRLDHPAIARVFEVGCVGPSSFMAMELVPGEPLSLALRRHRQREERMPIDVITRVGAAMAFALDYAHELAGEDGRALQIIHRDVSPQNVILGFDGSVKLIDFGVARWADSTTRTGTRAGKLRYFSPEQVHGRRVDRRTDIFSLGVMLSEALVGKPIFTGDNDAAVMHAILTGEPPDMGAGPAALVAALRRAIAKDPEARFATAKEFGQALAPDVVGAVSTVAPRLPDPLLAAYMADLMPRRKARWETVVEQARAGMTADSMAATSIASSGAAAMTATEPRTSPPAAASALPAFDSRTAAARPVLPESRVVAKPLSRLVRGKTTLAGASVAASMILVAIGWHLHAETPPGRAGQRFGAPAAPLARFSPVGQEGKPGIPSAPAPSAGLTLVESGAHRFTAPSGNLPRTFTRHSELPKYPTGRRGKHHRAASGGPPVSPHPAGRGPVDELEPSPY
jgi:eukaryotic-like serine/threonine-protein kinase